MCIKQTSTKINKSFLILQYSTLKNTIVQYKSWHTEAGIKWIGKKSYWLEVGDGRAEGSSAIGDGGQAAISVTPDIDRTHVHIFESLQLEGSYVRDLLYFSRPMPGLCTHILSADSWLFFL